MPTYLFPSSVENDSNIIDTYAVSEVCDKFNVKETEVHGALLSGDPHDQLAIAYHLIIDNKRFADEAAKAEIKDFYVAASPPPMKFSPSDRPGSAGASGYGQHASHDATAAFRPHPERIAPLRERGTINTVAATASGAAHNAGGVSSASTGTQASVNAAAMAANPLNASGVQSAAAAALNPHLLAPPDAAAAAAAGKNVAPRGTPVKRAKWHLGIRSQSKPNDIMLEVYRAMKALDYEWKIINAYHVRVRRVNREDETLQDMKMSLQLYQVDAKSYLLDFKSLTNEEVEQGDDVIMESLTPPNPLGPAHMPHQPTGHHTMEFFEMCAALIIQLAR